MIAKRSKGTIPFCLSAALTAGFSAGCVVTVAEPRYIEGIEVCAHVYDSLGDLTYFNATIRMSGRNNDKGRDYAAQETLRLDGTGRNTPCTMFLLESVSGNENTGIKNPKLSVVADGRASGPSTIDSNIYYNDFWHMHVLKIYGEFDMDRYASESKELIKHFMKKRLKEIATGTRSAKLDDDGAVKRPSPAQDSPGKKPSAEKQLAI